MSEHDSTESQRASIDATVVSVLDLDSFESNQVVINRGSQDDVQLGQRYLVYTLSDKEFLDPETNEPLGAIELVRGTGRVVHVQSRMATIKSDMSESKTIRLVQQKTPFATLFGTETREERYSVVQPFDRPAVGDRARRV